MKSILFVDDEKQILKSLKRLFMDTEYELFTAESGDEALEILKEEQIDLVISDMRMPKMDGYQLLSNVKKSYPKIMRLILSGYADEKTVFQALKQNVAKVYIFKPWNNEALLKLVDQIFSTEAILNSSDLLILINNAENLPTINSSFENIIKMIDNEAEMSKVAKEIEKDPSITTKILHIANSAYYGGKTASIHQAISFIGLQNIRNLVVTTSIFDAFDNVKIPPKYLDIIWQHSFLTNKILQFTYSKILKKKMNDSFSIAGLLHNIGIIFLINSFSKNYLKIFKDSIDGTDKLEDLEKRNFKVTHSEAGGYLLKWWELPFPIIESALYHHQPFDNNIVNSELLLIIHISQNYAWKELKIDTKMPFFDKTFDILEINRNKFEKELQEFI